jgi:hypothetical protein
VNGRWERGARCGSSLIAVALLTLIGTPGCLDDAPEYPPRSQVPPFIVSAQVTPPLSEVYEAGVPMRINVPFRSEDVNEDLNARFYADLLRGDTDFLFEGDVNPIEPSTYDDTGRSVSWEWRNERPLRPGCHSLTLVLTYENNLDNRQLPLDESRTARVVWWMNLNDPQGTTLIRSCPHSN